MTSPKLTFNNVFFIIPITGRNFEAKIFQQWHWYKKQNFIDWDYWFSSFLLSLFARNRLSDQQISKLFIWWIAVTRLCGRIGMYWGALKQCKKPESRAVQNCRCLCTRLDNTVNILCNVKSISFAVFFVGCSCFAPSFVEFTCADTETNLFAMKSRGLQFPIGWFRCLFTKYLISIFLQILMTDSNLHV